MRKQTCVWGEKKTLDSRTRKELSSWKKINSKKEKLDCLTSPALLLIREPPQPWFYSPPAPSSLVALSTSSSSLCSCGAS